VPYELLKPEHIAVVDLDNKVVEGSLNPSSDTPTHAHLYRHFGDIGGIAHTHSTYATAWAQARQPIPCFGTTHADYAYGEIPCTVFMSTAQIERDYEEETGVQITGAFADRDPNETPMVIVAGHGPFTWGKDAADAVHHAVVLEEVARMAYLTKTIDPSCGPLKQDIVDKHYLRRHGKKAYYGQD
jgi:L-ribulose-5-phosphate 4-epimerase